uniref:Uncharacterized protein n=1 Tax=Moumouvirus sp. 'Monve' TaxID=1128131 RepID=H2EEP9_9VIRU|nr:hypothetical protein mv_L667 [Moumouvirus Monve]
MKIYLFDFRKNLVRERGGQVKLQFFILADNKEEAKKN